MYRANRLEQALVLTFGQQEVSDVLDERDTEINQNRTWRFVQPGHELLHQPLTQVGERGEIVLARERLQLLFRDLTVLDLDVGGEVGPRELELVLGVVQPHES